MQLPGPDGALETHRLEVWRIRGSSTPGRVGVYVASLDGHECRFRHRYGDGWERCVAGALFLLADGGAELDPFIDGGVSRLGNTPQMQSG